MPSNKKRVLVVGGRGLVGRGVIDAYADDPQWSVTALSRQDPDFDTDATFISVDLTDRVATFETLSFLGSFERVVYTALFEKPDLVGGWRDADQIDTNVAMLTNLLDSLEPTEHLTLLQGTKAYGAHLRPMQNPGKEWHPRTPGPNFYWPQEDLVVERSRRGGWGYAIHRPQIVCGAAVGSPMNMTVAIGVYAAVSKALGEPLHFPGGEPFVTQATDAGLLGRAIRWAAEEPRCRNETFNITNGDELVWRSVWPAVADAFDMAVGDDRPARLAEVMPTHADTWTQVVATNELQPLSMDRLVGSSWQFADAAFGVRGSQNTLLSTIKARQFGFSECVDTEVMFADQFRWLQGQRILPG